MYWTSCPWDHLTLRSSDDLDLTLPWRRWCCQCALAARMAYSFPPSCPIGPELWSLRHCDVHLLAVVTDVVQPLLRRSSFWTTKQKQMWMAVTSHAGHMRVCRTWTMSLWYPTLLVCPNFVYGLFSLHRRSFSTLTSQKLSNKDKITVLSIVQSL